MMNRLILAASLALVAASAQAQTGRVTTAAPTYTTGTTAPLSLQTDGDARVNDEDNGSLLTDLKGFTDGLEALLTQGVNSFVKSEDTAAVNLDDGAAMMAVRTDTPADASSDGDYAFLQMAAGRLWTSTVIGAALPTGTNNIGDVDVLTLPALVTGTANIGDVDVLTLPALPTGANAIGKLAANSGVDIGDVTLTANSGVDIGDVTLTANSGVDIGDVDVASLPALPTGTNNIGDVDVVSSVLPPDAATETTLGAINNKLVLNAASIPKFEPVAPDGTSFDYGRPDTATRTATSVLTSSFEALNANAARRKFTLRNTSTATIWCRYGTTAVTAGLTGTSDFYILSGSWGQDALDEWAGDIQCIGEAANGQTLATELSNS